MGRYSLGGRVARSPLNPGWVAGQGLRGASSAIDDLSPFIAQTADKSVDAVAPVLEQAGGDILGELGGELLGDAGAGTLTTATEALDGIPVVGPALSAAAKPFAAMGGKALGTMAGKATAVPAAKLGGRMLTRMASDALDAPGTMLSGGSDTPSSDRAGKGLSMMRTMKGFSPFGPAATGLADTLSGIGDAPSMMDMASGPTGMQPPQDPMPAPRFSPGGGANPDALRSMGAPSPPPGGPSMMGPPRMAPRFSQGGGVNPDAVMNRGISGPRDMPPPRMRPPTQSTVLGGKEFKAPPPVQAAPPKPFEPQPMSPSPIAPPPPSIGASSSADRDLIEAQMAPSFDDFLDIQSKNRRRAAFDQQRPLVRPTSALR